MSQTIRDAVILMAGTGSRLRAFAPNLPKPLIPVLNRPLISFIIDALVQSGITKIHAVVGFQREILSAALKSLVPADVELRFIDNPDWQKQNGISVLAAAGRVTAPFLLTMGDHLFDRSIVDLIIRDANPKELNVAVDKKLGSVLDLEDAMKVQVQNDRIIAIGKTLQNYDAIDTGLFVCSDEIFGYLDRAKQNGDCSLANGVGLMAAEGKVRAIDIGNAWWQDVDTPQMLQRAEEMMRGLTETKLTDRSSRL